MTSTNFNVIKTELSWAVQATVTFINIVHDTKLNANKYKNLTLTERAEISQNPPVGRCQSAAHSPITEGNTAAPGGGTRMLLLHSTQTRFSGSPHIETHCDFISISIHSISTLCRTFGATLTISCVRIRDFPVQLAAFFVESLQDLSHFIRPASATQLQVLPVELQSGAGILYAVVGFPLNVEVWEPHKDKDIRNN